MQIRKNADCTYMLLLYMLPLGCDVTGPRCSVLWHSCNYYNNMNVQPTYYHTLILSFLPMVPGGSQGAISDT